MRSRSTVAISPGGASPARCRRTEPVRRQLISLGIRVTVGVRLFVVLAVYCLQQFSGFPLGLGRIGGVGGCLVWLLSGFGVSDINSATGAPYVVFPVILYALGEYLRRGGTLRFLAAVA